MRVMAIDYGDVRTGVAFSDLSRTMAGLTLVLEEKQTGRLVGKLAELSGQHGVVRIVVGNPLNMDGTESARSEKSRILASLLRDATGLQVDLWDERRTSADAHRILHENGKHGKKNKQRVDAVASALILEAYLPTLK